MMRSRAVRALLAATGPVVAIVVWAAWSSSADSYYFPPLSDIVSTFADTWVFERVSSDVVPSLTRLLAGFFIAVAVAVSLGMLIGLSRRMRAAAMPIVELLRATPPPALLPLGIVVLGVGATMKVAIIALVCVFPVLLSTIDGVQGMDPTFDETARGYRISRADRVRHVLLPAASPQIFAGMRTSLSLALILMVISEMVASTNGIGYFVLQAQRTFAIPEMWSGIVLLGILGYALNAVLLIVESVVLRWHRGARASAMTT